MSGYFYIGRVSRVLPHLQRMWQVINVPLYFYPEVKEQIYSTLKESTEQMAYSGYDFSRRNAYPIVGSLTGVALGSYMLYRYGVPQNVRRAASFTRGQISRGSGMLLRRVPLFVNAYAIRHMIQHSFPGSMAATALTAFVFYQNRDLFPQRFRNYASIAANEIIRSSIMLIREHSLLITLCLMSRMF